MVNSVYSIVSTYRCGHKMIDNISYGGNLFVVLFLFILSSSSPVGTQKKKVKRCRVL